MNSLSEKLKNTLKSGSAVHAYLITGIDLKSIYMLAAECSALLMFGTEETQRLANSPDYFSLEGTSGIEDFRDVRRELYKRTFTGGNRVVCIKNAHLLNESCVNAMLKMLEEPPAGTYFILTGIERRILPTIRSRCFIVRMGSNSKQEIKTALLNKLNASPEQAEMYASACCGSMSKAFRLYKDEDYRSLRENALNAFSDMLNGGLPFSWSKQLSKDRDGAKESVEFMLFACHDLMLLKCGLPVDANPDKKPILKEAAARFTLKQIGCIIDLLTDADAKLNTNASVNQSIDGLIVEITEVK